MGRGIIRRLDYGKEGLLEGWIVGKEDNYSVERWEEG